MIYCQSEGDSGNVSVSSGETRTHLLTGLQSGVDYIISIVAVIQIPSPVSGPITASVSLSDIFTFTKFHATIKFSIHLVIEPPEVDVTGFGSSMPGTSYTLICSVTLPSGVQLEDPATPTIQWLGPDTSTLTPVGPTVISDGVYTSTVILFPLLETHTGQYVCEARYSLGGLMSPQVEDRENITVIRKLHVHNH